MRRAWRVAALALAVAGQEKDGPHAALPISKGDLARLETAAKDLATKGRGAEMDALLEVIAAFGEEPAALAKLHESCSKTLAKVKTAPTGSAGSSGSAVATVSRTLRGVASGLSKQLATLDDQARGALAEQILRIDDDQPLAHQTLSHVLENSRWQSVEWKAILDRRRDLQAAVAKARNLDAAAIQLDVKPSTFKPMAAIDPKPATSVRFGDVEVISPMEPARIERVVRSALQAMALSNWIRGFGLEVPSALKRSHQRYLFLTSKEQYLRSIDLAEAAGGLKDAKASRVRELSGYTDDRDFYVSYDVSEVGARAEALYCFQCLWLDEDTQPCLLAGHCNWLCLTFFGTSMPGTAVPPEEQANVEGRTSAGPRDLPEEKQAKDLAKAGLSGARRWLLFKAMRGEDPAWARSFVDEIGLLEELDLLKSTFVVEYLQELGEFDAMLRKSTPKEGEPRSRTQLIEAQIPEGLAWFEQRFDAWLLPRGAAIVQRLEQAPPGVERLSKDELAAQVELDRVRRAAWDERIYGTFAPTPFDRELSDGCADHVRYLALHPAQLAKWPDAHEEYPEETGFTTTGCWSGMHSVIAPGVDSAEEAITAWMNTFYHRLPLIDPGLKRFGFSMSGHVAVLDADSLVEASRYEGFVLWPPRDMVNVPTHFEPGGELPSPVPGQDERDFGYPITLQTTLKNVEVKMRLVRGAKADGPEVPCHFSSPGHPTNLDCAPANSFCLMPKSPLDGKTKYTVIAEPAGGEPLQWTFTTR